MSTLYRIIKPIPETEIQKKNKSGSWAYGYNDTYDIIVISKDGTIGDIYEINSLKIALPSPPLKIDNKNNRWKPTDVPDPLKRIKSIFEWNKRDNDFKLDYIDFIEGEFDKREYGYWFMNKGIKTYITGSQYVYLNYSKIDVGLPDFRESNRILFIYWEACKADNRSFGMCYLKNRRSGFSFMSSSEGVNIGTLAKDARIGILSKTGSDAKIMFTNKVVPILKNYPFFFKPVQDGSDNPKTELAFRVPASRITKRSMMQEHDEFIDGLDTSIDWKNTDDNSYDGEKLKFLIQDESGKWLKPNNILNNWRVTKTCLRLGSRIIGKCMMGSTSNAKSKGGAEFKSLYEDSNPRHRSANGQTKSGLYALFIPMEHNLEGFIDEYGHSIVEDPRTPVKNIEGDMVSIGAITYWEREADVLKRDQDALNEFYRQFPRTEAHAFRDESKESIFNLTKLYAQIDFNDGQIHNRYLNRGNFSWKNGEKDTKVVFTPDNKGRFIISWIPPLHLQNRVLNRNGQFIPLNDNLGAFGCDPYDISGTVSGSGSNGALHGLTKFSMEENVPSNVFFLEYIARPQTAEIFFEDVLMACFFYGMPMLCENNKPRLLYHFKNRGYRKFSLNRPDKRIDQLSKTERELGGIPSSSEDIKQAHASCIETYIETHVGYDTEGTYRDPEEIGNMPFQRTLLDWANFNISNRERHDASISSGYAIMANNKHQFQPEQKKSKISVTFARYNNKDGLSSKLETYE